MDELTPYLERVVLVGNRKGGCLKSSIVRSVADEAAKAGHRVLAIDGDPQGNLSKVNFGLGETPEGWDADRGRSLAMAMQFGTTLEPMPAHGVDVVCGGPMLAGVIGAALADPGVDLAGNLRSSLAQLNSERTYDLVLIDSGPGDTKVLDAYMATARWLVVPIVEGDENSMDGLDKMGARWVELHNQGADLDVLGAVLTLVDPRATTRNAEVLGEVADALGASAEPFRTMIRDNKAARRDATRYGLSAGQVAEQAKHVKRKRISALRDRAAAKLRGGDINELALTDPDEPWDTRNADPLARDYRELTGEIVTRMAAKLGTSHA